MEEKELEQRKTLREEYICKGEINFVLEELRNKCLRTILWTSETILKDKNSNEFKLMRKSILDSVNDFHREASSIINKCI